MSKALEFSTKESNLRRGLTFYLAGIILLVLPAHHEVSAQVPGEASVQGPRVTSVQGSRPPEPGPVDSTIVMGRGQEFRISPEAAARIEKNPRAFNDGAQSLPLRVSLVDTRLIIAVHPAARYLVDWVSMLSSTDPPQTFTRIVRTRVGYGPAAVSAPFSRKAVQDEIEKVSALIREDISTAIKGFARTEGINAVFDHSAWRLAANSKGSAFSSEGSGSHQGGGVKPGSSGRFGIADFKASINPGDRAMGHFEDLLREGSSADRVFRESLGTLALYLEPFKIGLLASLTATRSGKFETIDEPSTRKVAENMLKNLGVRPDVLTEALKFIDENSM